MAGLRKRLPGLIVMILACALGLLTGHACGSGMSDDTTPKDSGTTGGPDSSGGGLCSRCSVTQHCCTVGGVDACVDKNDRNNCGTCGNICTPDVADSCSGGQCACALTPACTGGKSCCPTGTLPGCADFATDKNHCGNCMTACGPNQVCQNRACVCGGSGAGDAGVARTCTANEMCCTQGCTNTMNDPMNCGGCGQPCPVVQGQQLGCFGGQCRCGAGGAACPTAGGITGGMPVLECCGADCVDVCSAATNCGGCGISCSGSIINTCLGGSCLGGSGDQPDGGIPPGCSILPIP